MKRAIVAAILLLLPIGFSSSAVAQDAEDDLRELYILCSRSPLNSRCQGLDIPIPLEQRSGVEVHCLFDLGYPNQWGNCKVNRTPEGITVYIEDGDPIALLDDKRATLDVTIPHGDVLGLAISNFGGDADFAIASLTFRTDATSEAGNRSNVLNILSDRGLLDSVYNYITVQPDTVRTTLQSGEPVVAASVAQLLETRSCVRCDLRGANLQGADLDRANLEGANLQGANLSNAQLDRAYLVGANLNDANLNGAELEYARLIATSFTGAVLDGADLRGANLLYADMQRANLNNTNLRVPTYIQNTNFSNATLTNADLRGITMSQTSFQNADLSSANFGTATVSIGSIVPVLGTGDFSTLSRITVAAPAQGRLQTILSNVNLREANLSNANLDSALLDNADLSRANLSGADLEDAELQRANLCGATMPDNTISQQGCEASLK